MSERLPGWYRYPGDPTGHRYWNGEAWTAHETLQDPEPAPEQDQNRDHD